MKYQNPILSGFHPDPSVCRVGRDYYLVTSSFEYFPGIPVFHSTDLVSWEQLGNCVSRPEQLPTETWGDSGGIWAPTIRFHNGVFYVAATVDGLGNCIFSTKDIHGDWSDPVWVEMDGIDPSLYFEDDKVYFCTNAREHKHQEEISLAEIDLQTGRLTAPYRAVWAGTGGGFLEGPHIYHIGDWYYLLAAEGGTSYNHMATVGRSRSIYGPYEACPHNPVLTNRGDTTKSVLCAGHGDLVEDTQGSFWMVHLGTRPCQNNKSNLGRETFLTPVIWKDGFPFVEGGRAVLDGETHSDDAPRQSPKTFRCDFALNAWEPEWISLRGRSPAAMERAQGLLKLFPAGSDFSRPAMPAFTAIRQPAHCCTAEAVMDFIPQKIGEEAGLIAYLQSDFYYSVGKRKTADGDCMVVTKNAGDFRQTAYCQKIPSGELRLKIVADKSAYHFYYAVAGDGFVHAADASTLFLCAEAAPRCFTGTLLGVYALGSGSSGAYAAIRNFTLDYSGQ